MNKQCLFTLCCYSLSKKCLPLKISLAVSFWRHHLNSTSISFISFSNSKVTALLGDNSIANNARVNVEPCSDCCRMQSTGWHLSWCFSKYKSEHLRNCPSRGICPQRTSCSSNSWCQGISMTNKKSQFLVWGPSSLLNLPSPERYLCRTSYMATGKAGQSSEDPSPAPCGTGWEDSFVTWQWYLPLLPIP